MREEERREVEEESLRSMVCGFCGGKLRLCGTGIDGYFIDCVKCGYMFRED